MILRLVVFGAFLALASADLEPQTQAHNVVLYPLILRDIINNSWCEKFPIHQVITSPGYQSVTVDNSICVGACYSYSIPKTQPAEPGEIIQPYCDSCQPNVTKCYHVTLDADDSNVSGPRTMQKRIEIIESCECNSCSKYPLIGCKTTEEETPELPRSYFKDRDETKTKTSTEVPELFRLKIDGNTLNKRNKSVFENEIDSERRHYEVPAKAVELLKRIQTESLENLTKFDKQEIRELIDVIGVGMGKKLDDRNLLEFVNYVNGMEIDEDFELDVDKLKEVITAFQRNVKNDFVEKHRSFWLEFADNDQIEEDLRRLKLSTDFAVEGSRLGMDGLKGSHMGIGIKTVDVSTSTIPRQSTTTTTAPSTSTAAPSTTQSPPASTANTQQNNKRHHHHLNEEQRVGSEMGHLVKGPHGSMVLSPDIKVEEKLNLESDALTPNHQGVVISYTGGEESSRPKLLDD